MSPPSQTAMLAAAILSSCPQDSAGTNKRGNCTSLTFSCYRRRAKFAAAPLRAVFERALEQTRRSYRFGVLGYVVMPEHVHLLVSEPDSARLSTAIQALKQSVSRSLALRHAEPFWQARYYDFNVWSDRKRIEKLRYIHRNPVTRGLVAKPEDWQWSSFRHYQTGVEGAVEIESEATAQRREQVGIRPKVRPGPARILFENPARIPRQRTIHRFP